VNLTRALIGGLALSVAGICAAAAQDAPPAPPPKPDVKTVEDWQVRCYPVQSAAPCDMLQEQGDQQSGRKILSISISYVPSMDKHALIVTVPLEVSLAKGIVLQTDSYTSPTLKYRTCTRDGCFVQTAVDNDLVASVAKSSGDAKVNVVGDDGKTYSIKFSLKGFTQAHDDMMSQAKAKATKPAQAGTTPAPAPH
jgi:invasion protein IalB